MIEKQHKYMIEKQHKALIDFIKNPTSVDDINECCLIKSMMEGRHEEHIIQIKKILNKQPKEFCVKSDGRIVGFGKYEVLDTRWAESLIVFLETLVHCNRFKTNPPIIQIPNQTKIAVFGDFGTGDWNGRNIATIISNNIKNLNPDISIHLGDIYYAGTPEEAMNNLLKFWPTAPMANFTMNGNHEMYDGGKGYFETVLTNAIFAKQQQNSYFALENDHWIIICLDTAYHAGRHDLYLNGKIDQHQENFLREINKKNKPIILMTHHNPIDLAGEERMALYDEIINIIGSNLQFWYYGHIHCGAVYKKIDGINFRLLGHASLPYGNASVLNNSKNVIWYEKNPISNNKNGIEVQNGFSFLQLDNEKIIEEFYGEDEKIHWSNEN